MFGINGSIITITASTISVWRDDFSRNSLGTTYPTIVLWRNETSALHSLHFVCLLASVWENSSAFCTVSWIAYKLNYIASILAFIEKEFLDFFFQLWISNVVIEKKWGCLSKWWLVLNFKGWATSHNVKEEGDGDCNDETVLPEEPETQNKMLIVRNPIHLSKFK